MPPKPRRHSVRKRMTISNARSRPRPRPPAAPSRICGYFEEVIGRAFALDAERHGRYQSLESLERALRLVWDALRLVDNATPPLAGELQSAPQLNFEGVLENLRDHLGAGLPCASSPSPMPRSASSFPVISPSADPRSPSDDTTDANQTVPSAAPPSPITVSTDDEGAAQTPTRPLRTSPAVAVLRSKDDDDSQHCGRSAPRPRRVVFCRYEVEI